MSEGIVKLGTNHYRIRVRATCPRTGKEKELDRVRRCTLTEARALQHQWREEFVGELAKPATDRVRLRDFATSWLDGREGDLKISSATKIAIVWDLHIAPHKIADLYVDEIKLADVEDWIAWLRAQTYVPGKGKRGGRRTRSEKSKARPYSKGTVKGYYRVLAQLLNVATARAGVRNPCDGLERIKPGKRRKNFLAPDEVGKVLAHVLEHNPLLVRNV